MKLLGKLHKKQYFFSKVSLFISLKGENAAILKGRGQKNMTHKEYFALIIGAVDLCSTCTGTLKHFLKDILLYTNILFTVSWHKVYKE